MALKCAGPVSIILPRMMDHNEFDFVDDLVQPFYSFLRQLGISLAVAEGEEGQIKFPEYLYLPPQQQIDAESNDISFWYWLLKKIK
jgi:hypothetical protein